MSQVNVKSPLDQARENAQAFYKKIEAATATNHAQIRSNLEKVSTDAQKLGINLKALGEEQKADAKLHLKEAQLAFEDTAKRANEALAGTDADLKKKNQAVIGRARQAVAHLSQAVAARRASTTKPSAN
ncbi:MAG TPA: hypothetical protein VKF82_10485 [Candidatus Eremiobacteraceae bacterium]|nr:hypothetical protein [Candidatus Eremiobacteraceae bacterium]